MAGIRQRPIQCVREGDNVTVPLSFCATGDRFSGSRHLDSSLMESCDVACPRDCELTAFSDWSTCSASCGVESLRKRERRVRRPERRRGRRCPERSALTQVRDVIPSLVPNYLALMCLRNEREIGIIGICINLLSLLFSMLSSDDMFGFRTCLSLLMVMLKDFL